MNKLLSFIRRKILRIPADRWDYQYQRGEWDNLGKESVRFDAVMALIRSSYRQPAILEIGCGKALMLRQMEGDAFRIFTGIDLSAVAINSARRFEKHGVRFVQADMQTFIPEDIYDVIAFNESLYYVKDPATIFERYLPYLAKGGCIIVTAFDNKYTAHLWPSIEARWQPVHAQMVSSGRQRWSIRMYQPAGK